MIVALVHEIIVPKMKPNETLLSTSDGLQSGCSKVHNVFVIHRCNILLHNKFGCVYTFHWICVFVLPFWL